MLQKINIATIGSKSAAASFYLLMEDINEQECKNIVQWIIESNLAEQEDKPEILNLMICSQGGELAPAFAVIDVMRGSTIPMRTIGLGQIASAALMIFMAGDKGNRVLTPNTSIMSHQWFGGAIGKAHELIAQAKEFDLTSKRVIAHYKKCTGLTEQEVHDKLLQPHDIYLTAAEAQKLGIADIVKDLN